jgi:hypothetical protein
MSATLTRVCAPPSVTVHRLLCVGAAAMAGFVGWIGIHVVGDIDLTVGSGRHAHTIGAGHITASAVAAALVGWAVLAVIERRIGPGRRALQLWTRLSLGLTAASLLGPLTADASTSTRCWLIALHVSVAAAFIPQMNRRAWAGC